MKRFFAAALALALCLPTASAFAQEHELLGSWKNTDRDTRGVTKFTVASEGPETMRVNLFGACSPNDCDWGPTQALRLSESIDSTTTNAMFAYYDQGFVARYVTVRLGRNDERALMDVISIYRDGSGRENTMVRYRFKRVERPNSIEGVEFETDRAGNDFRRFELLENTPIICRDACRGDTRCQAWTLVKPGVQSANAVCYLKAPAPNPTPNTCCASGVVER